MTSRDERVYNRVRAAGDDGIGVSRLVDDLHISHGRVRFALDALVHAGLVVLEENRRRWHAIGAEGPPSVRREAFREAARWRQRRMAQPDSPWNGGQR